MIGFNQDERQDRLESYKNYLIPIKPKASRN